MMTLRADLPGEVDQQGIEGLHRDRRAAVARKRRGLAAHHGDALLDRERLRLRGIVGDADHEMIDQLHGALDDVEMAERDRIEGAGIEPDALGAHSSPSPELSAMRSTDTTRSPSSSRNSTTPCAERRCMLMPETGTRMVLP